MEYICNYCGKTFVDSRKIRQTFKKVYCSRLCKQTDDKLRTDTKRNKHNLHKSKSYKTYYAMLQRCNNPNHSHYKYYGGRGIKVCDRWLESFENFYEDMGERPEDLTLDRIDVNKGYYPENCKWSTRSEQNSNKRVYAKSGVRGLLFKNNRWHTTVKFNGKPKYLGCFKTKEEAINVIESWKKENEVGDATLY